MKTEETFEEDLKSFKEKLEKDKLRIGRLEFTPYAKILPCACPRIDLHDVIWRLDYIMKMLLNARELNDSRFTQVANEMVSLREEVIKKRRQKSQKRKPRRR